LTTKKGALWGAFFVDFFHFLLFFVTFFTARNFYKLFFTIERGKVCYFFLLLVTFVLFFYCSRFIVCYFLLLFLLLVTFINYFFIVEKGQGNCFIIFIHCSRGRGVP
jgi:hypothetical protein